METWSRREHFNFFTGFDYPHFGMCANVELSPFFAEVRRRRISLTAAIVYVIARVANTIPEFRYRIRSGEVVEHEMVSPAVTIMRDNGLFSFCTIDWCEDFPLFSERVMERITRVKQQSTLVDESGRDDLLYMSVIPWVSFTSFTHPIHLHPVDSIPRFAWGKLFEEGPLLKMPLAAQGHHALMDGMHIGKFYEMTQDLFNHPSVVFGEDG